MGRALCLVTPLGRWVIGAGALAWLVGGRLGWKELLLVAGGCLVATVLALASTAGRSPLSVELEMSPLRVTAGEQSVGRIAVQNTGRRRVFGIHLEAPIGTGVARFDAPSLGIGDSWDDIFIVPTPRRAILDVGPARTVRGDPLGLARREVISGERMELFVHPRIVRLVGSTAGWLRDLEGRTTNDLSPSDVAFHTLREYVPGDDRRHVHWRTSARLGRLMVRQYVDTRRSHLGLVLSTDLADYATDDEFELAVSIVGSLGVGALADDQTVTVTTGGKPLPAVNGQRLLDGLSGLERGRGAGDVRDLVKRSIPLVRGASVVALVGGSSMDPSILRGAAQRFGHDVRVLAIRAIPGVALARRELGSVFLLEVGDMADLARMMRATVSR